jgi:hypothetical protein
METLRSELIHLASTNPELRKDLLPLLKSAGRSKRAFDMARMSLGIANLLFAILTSEDEDEILEIPSLVTNLITALKAIQINLGTSPDGYRNFQLLLGQALTRKVKIIL